MNNHVIALDAETGRKTALCDLLGDVRTPLAFAVADQGRRILAGKGDLLRLLDGAGKTLWEKKMQTGRVEGVCFTPNGGVISVGNDGMLRLWDGSSGRLQREASAFRALLNGNHISALCPSGDGKQLLVGFEGHMPPPTLLLSLDERDMAAGGRNFWSKKTRIPPTYPLRLSGFGFSPDSQWVLGGGSLWSVKDTEKAQRGIAPDILRGGICGSCFLPGGKWAFLCGANGWLVLADAANGKALYSANLGVGLKRLCVAEDNAFLAGVDKDGKIHVLLLDWEYR